MAPSKGGAKRTADDTDMDTDKEDTKRAVRRTRGAAGIIKSALKAETDNTPGGDGAGPGAPAAVPPAAPAAQPIQMNIPTIVQELNSLMLTLHSRAIENQQESASLLAVSLFYFIFFPSSRSIGPFIYSKTNIYLQPV